MRKYNFLIYFLINLSFVFSFEKIVGVMVDFQLDDDPETSGDGTFLLDDNQNLDLGYIHYPDISKCNTFDKLDVPSY